MILLAASSMVINAGDNTGYISPVDSPKLSLSPVDLEEAFAPPSTPQQTTIQAEIDEEKTTNTGYISPVDSPKLSLWPVDLEEARTSPSTPQQTTIQEDFPEELNDDTPRAGNGIFSRTASQISSESEYEEDVIVTQNLEEVFAPTAHELATLEETNSQVSSTNDESLSPAVLEVSSQPAAPEEAEQDAHSEGSSAGNGTFSRKNSEASSEPGVDDVSTTQAPVQNPIIDASSTNDEPLKDTTKKVSDVTSPATLEVSSLSASAAASSTFIDATPKKPVPELPWYKKLLGFFTTSK